MRKERFGSMKESGAKSPLARLSYATAVSRSQADTRGDSSQVNAAHRKLHLPCEHRASPSTMCQLKRRRESSASGNWYPVTPIESESLGRSEERRVGKE